MNELTELVNKLTKMWDSGGYDNAKDAILNCRDLLAKIPKDNKALRSKVEKVLEDATSMQLEVDPEDPHILVDPSY